MRFRYHPAINLNVRPIDKPTEIIPATEPPRDAHVAPCACPECMRGQTPETQGQRMNDYLKAKSLEWNV